ncbi:MAG: sigma-70 family RNA polymerase sigma factor [Oscillospiraceae bacterium]|nr:sigma-70 family RNA polymerase sigma factor [Oscillospiraceae bacterium]
MEHDTAEAVIRKYAAMVYRLAVAQLRSRDEAEDIVQEVFLRYLKTGPTFESEAHRKAWLLRVAVNCCRKAQRSPWRRMEPLSELLPAPERVDQELLALLEDLPAKYRTVLHLFYYEGYRAEEIGPLLGRKASTVRCQLTRGRALLKQKLEGEHDHGGTKLPGDL